MAVVKTNYVRRGKVGNAKAKDNARYIQHRPGKDKERVWRPLFTSDGPMTRLEAYQFIDEAPKGTHFYTVIVNPDPKTEDTHKDLDMRAITITTMQTIEEIVGQPVIWVAAVHDDHTDKNHVHALAAVPRRLDTPELNRIREATTQECLRERRELDRTLSRQAREREHGGWEPEPTLAEDAWDE
jgi:REP element-mobilizing transposase RayT